MSKIEVNEIVNQSGDNDSGIDLTTNDQIGFKIANASKWTLNSSGNLFPASTSQGIVFGATSDTSANRLDDYEEGTWTPVYESGSTNPTFSANLQDGRYTKIGRLVYASFRLRGAITGTKTGSLILAGLPFTSNTSAANGSGGVGLTENFGSDNYPTNLRVAASANYIQLMVCDSSDPRDGLFTNVTVSSTSGSSSGNYIIGHVVYQE